MTELERQDLEFIKSLKTDDDGDDDIHGDEDILKSVGSPEDLVDIGSALNEQISAANRIMAENRELRKGMKTILASQKAILEDNARMLGFVNALAKSVNVPGFDRASLQSTARVEGDGGKKNADVGGVPMGDVHSVEETTVAIRKALEGGKNIPPSHVALAHSFAKNGQPFTKGLQTMVFGEPKVQ